VSTLVLGAGISGKAAAALAGRNGHDVRGFDESPAAAAAASQGGARFTGGAWTSDQLDGVELVVTSPGIPEHSPMIRDTLESGTPLVSELEFAARHATAPVIAVTGTNGKTSTVEAAAAMLARAGAEVCAAGNIGTALSDVAEGSWDVLVIEASSFQLRFIDTFRPRSAAILNVTPDHLDWHGTFDAYLAAKRRITMNQDGDDLLVFGADDEGATAAASATEARALPVSGARRPPGGVGPQGGSIRVGGSDFSVPSFGPDFVCDLAAAAVLADRHGAGPEAIARTLGSFRPGAHRRRTVGTWDAVRWVDDSKATNPEAAVAAAAAFPSVILIAGGRNKGLDLTPMGGMPTVRRIFAIGESADDLVALDPDRTTRSPSLEKAVAAADGAAVPGDTVLLAPGCASFDMFGSYAERGDEFARLIRERKGADGH
jgi:UDP-N-acetylmuramoylalanine--D-glutamate ligase